MRERRPLVFASALLGLLIGTLSAGGPTLPVLLERTSAPGLYVAVLSLLTFLLSPVAVLALGYWVGSRVDVAADYGRITLFVGLSGGVASFVGYTGVMVGVAPDVATDVPVLLSGGFNAAVRVVDFGVTGLAGAAVAHFRSS